MPRDINVRDECCVLICSVWCVVVREVMCVVMCGGEVFGYMCGDVCDDKERMCVK